MGDKIKIIFVVLTLIVISSCSGSNSNYGENSDLSTPRKNGVIKTKMDSGRKTRAVDDRFLKFFEENPGIKKSFSRWFFKSSDNLVYQPQTERPFKLNVDTQRSKDEWDRSVSTTRDRDFSTPSHYSKESYSHYSQPQESSQSEFQSPSKTPSKNFEKVSPTIFTHYSRPSSLQDPLSQFSSSYSKFKSAAQEYVPQKSYHTIKKTTPSYKKLNSVYDQESSMGYPDIVYYPKEGNFKTPGKNSEDYVTQSDNSIHTSQQKPSSMEVILRTKYKIHPEIGETAQNIYGNSVQPTGSPRSRVRASQSEEYSQLTYPTPTRSSRHLKETKNYTPFASAVNSLLPQEIIEEEVEPFLPATTTPSMILHYRNRDSIEGSSEPDEKIHENFQIPSNSEVSQGFLQNPTPYSQGYLQEPSYYPYQGYLQPPLYYDQRGLPNFYSDTNQRYLETPPTYEPSRRYLEAPLSYPQSQGYLETPLIYPTQEYPKSVYKKASEESPIGGNPLESPFAQKLVQKLEKSSKKRHSKNSAKKHHNLVADVAMQEKDEDAHFRSKLVSKMSKKSGLKKSEKYLQVKYLHNKNLYFTPEFLNSYSSAETNNYRGQIDRDLSPFTQDDSFVAATTFRPFLDRQYLTRPTKSPDVPKRRHDLNYYSTRHEDHIFPTTIRPKYSNQPIVESYNVADDQQQFSNEIGYFPRDKMSKNVEMYGQTYQAVSPTFNSIYSTLNNFEQTPSRQDYLDKIKQRWRKKFKVQERYPKYEQKYEPIIPDNDWSDEPTWENVGNSKSTLFSPKPTKLPPMFGLSGFVESIEKQFPERSTKDREESHRNFDSNNQARLSTFSRESDAESERSLATFQRQFVPETRYQQQETITRERNQPIQEIPPRIQNSRQSAPSAVVDKSLMSNSGHVASLPSASEPEMMMTSSSHGNPTFAYVMDVHRTQNEIITSLLNSPFFDPTPPTPAPPVPKFTPDQSRSLSTLNKGGGFIPGFAKRTGEVSRSGENDGYSFNGKYQDENGDEEPVLVFEHKGIYVKGDQLQF